MMNKKVVCIIIFLFLIVVSSSGSSNLDKAKEYYYKGQFFLSASLFEKLLKENPYDEEILLMLGNSYVAIKEIDKSVETFKRGLSFSTNAWIFLFNLGYAYYLLGDYTNSLDAFYKVMSVNANFPRSYWFGGMSSLRVADVNTTINLWEKYLEIAPNGEESSNIALALKILKEKGTNAIPEILREIEEKESKLKTPEDILSDLDKFINNGHSGVQVQTGETLEDTSLEDIEK